MKSKSVAQDRWRFSATVLLPTLLVLLLTGGAIAIFVLWSTANLDDRTLERQSTMVSEILEQQRINVSHDQESIALTDEAYRQIRLERDFAWIGSQVGEWMHAFFDHDEIAILDESNQPIFLARNGVPNPPQTLGLDLTTSLIPLLKHLRTLIAAGAIEDFRSGKRMHPPSIGEFALIDGRPVILAVSPIIGRTAHSATPRGSEYVILSVVNLDQSIARRMSDQNLIANASFVLHPTAQQDRGAFPIVNRQGRIIAFFEWDRDRPGKLMLLGTGPVLIGGFVVAAIIVFLLMAQLRRSSAAIVEGQRVAEYQAAHDRLTGLPNRGNFDTHFSAQLADPANSGLPIHLLMLDLDRFKQVNDTLGHQAGDALIGQVSHRIRDIVGNGVFIARIGGDEFALVSSGDVALDPNYLSHRLIESIGRPYMIQNFQAVVGASIGIVTATGGNAEPHDLVRKADIALYEAKATGRNRAVLYEEHMNELLQLQHTIEAELRETLRNDDDQISVAFQPLVDQSTRRIVGAEALSRWHHPKFGQISPARFIPIAESTGLIEPLGERVLRQACMLGATQTGFKMAVNISPAQLRNPEFATLVFDILHATGMRAEDLELEITESILLDDEHVSAKNIMAFRSAGIHIALDDFGTGYSSLSYLKRYPVDRIKIDRSFVSQLAPGHVSVAITRALVTLAHAMNIQVTAEGVETEEQARILGELGCNTLQGFLFSGAVDANRIRVLFARPENLPKRRRTANVA